MIKITVIKKAEQYQGFVISGHAGYAKDDADDIICAAVSVLAVNTANSLEALAHVPVQAEKEDGYLSCQFGDGLNSEGKLLMDSMILGMQSICKNYGKKYTQLSFEEV